MKTIPELEEAIRLARARLEAAEAFTDEESLAYDAFEDAHENLRDAYRKQEEEESRAERNRVR